MKITQVWYFAIVLLAGISGPAYAQQKLSGSVRDASGELLPGANIASPGKPQLFFFTQAGLSYHPPRNNRFS